MARFNGQEVVINNYLFYIRMIKVEWDHAKLTDSYCTNIHNHQLLYKTPHYLGYEVEGSEMIFPCNFDRFESGKFLN